MMLNFPSVLFVLSSVLAFGVNEAAPEPPLETDYIAPVISTVVPMIVETSGIADSKAFPGYLWAHEDSGTPTQLHLINHSGRVEKKLIIKDAYNRDWEEMALSGGNIYIADIGDNRQIYERYWFYKFPEPGPGVDTVSSYQTILFQYPDGAHDAEAFLVDPQTQNIYIITKRDEPSRLYKLVYPYSDTALNTLELVGTLPYSGVVGAAIDPSGRQIILKTYPELLLYTRQAGKSLEQALIEGSYKKLPYQLEPQGEAVTFATDNSGIFTLSEKGFSSSVNLFFYPRKK